MSLFFFQEMDIKNCLNRNPKSTKNEKDRIPENLIYNKLNGSFLSINTENLSINDPAHEYKEYRKNLKSYLNIFKDHVLDYTHPINLISTKFTELFINFLSNKIDQINQIPVNKDFSTIALKNVEEVSGLIQKFILKLQTALRLMYCKTINYQFFTEERDEMINLVTNIIFKSENFYKKIFLFYEVSYKEQIKVFQDKIISMKCIAPEDLGIDVKFCLNETTINLQKKINDNELTTKGNSKIINENSNLERNTFTKLDDKINNPMYTEISSLDNETIRLSRPSIGLNNLPKVTDVDNDMKVYVGSLDSRVKPIQGKNRYPYEKAIKLLRSIKSYRIPFEKMLILSNISTEITNSVNVFWKEMDGLISPSYLNIDADELMSLFIYIIIKSQMSSLLVNMKIIKDFTTSQSKSTMIGYYFVTLDASILFILDMDLKKIEIDKNKIRNNIRPVCSSFVHDSDS